MPWRICRLRSLPLSYLQIGAPFGEAQLSVYHYRIEVSRTRMALSGLRGLREMGGRGAQNGSVRYAASNEDLNPLLDPHNGLGARSAPKDTV